MKRIKRRRLFIRAFKTAGADKVLLVYMVWFFVAAIPIWLVEPNIKSYGDSLWLCFASATSIGYGDVVATTVLSRVITIILSVYSIAVIAIITAVIVGYFNDVSKVRTNESLQKFADDLEHLPELSKEELQAISERVKRFRQKGK